MHFESNFWHSTILLEAMAFFNITSYKEGLEIQQMEYLLGENKINTKLILADLVELKALKEEGGRFFLTVEGFEHGKKAFKNIRQEQFEKVQKDKYTDERDRNGTLYVVHNFLTKFEKIREMKEEYVDDGVQKTKGKTGKNTGKVQPEIKTKKSKEPSKSLTLENLAIKRLDELYQNNKMSHDNIMPFVEVFSRLCSLFSITKDDAWSLLFSLEKQGLIEIVPYHGIKLKL